MYNPDGFATTQNTQIVKPTKSQIWALLNLATDPQNNARMTAVALNTNATTMNALFALSMVKRFEINGKTFYEITAFGFDFAAHNV